MRQIRVDAVAEFLISAVINTELSTDDIAAMNPEERAKLLWPAFQEDWFNVPNKLRDAKLVPFEVYEIGADEDIMQESKRPIMNEGEIKA